MKDSNKNNNGALLLSALFKKMNENGENKTDLAARFGISYSYIMALGKGRKVTGLTVEVIRSIAKYLDIPTAQAMMLAGALSAEDFYLDRTISERVELVFADLQTDTLLCGFAPTPEIWNKYPLSAKLLISVLYENNAKTKYLDAAKIVKIVESIDVKKPEKQLDIFR